MAYFKNLTKSLRDKITHLIIPPFPPKAKKRLLIIRIDAIGDFVLFSPFLAQMREFFGDYHITLLANNCVKNLALGLHSKNIDEFIFISPRQFNRSLFYRISFLHSLKKRHFTICLNPIYSRDLLCKEIISYINAQICLTPSGDDNNLPLHLKNANDEYYTALLPCKDGVLFEYYRNAEFCNNAFDFLKHFAESTAKNPKFTQSLPKARLDSALLPRLESFVGKNMLEKLRQNYCVLFIGASAKYRKWSVENFAKVARHLIAKYNQNIVICGGVEDKNSAKILVDLIDSAKVLDFSGQTSLMQLASLVYNGNLIVSNETSAAHFAVFLDTAIIAVYNGNHLGRFIPYPKNIAAKYYPAFHPFIKANMRKYRELSNAFAYKSDLDINEISAESVIKIIDEIYQNGGKNEK
ncbi:glycosyltransferase family 9 protein [Helicobacter sp. 23-1044]